MEGHFEPLTYVFRFELGGAECTVAAGRDVVTAFGSVEAFSESFGGHLTYGWPPSEGRYLGVRGKRKASRFRRILREQLGPLEILARQPPERMTLVTRVSSRD